MEKLSPNAESLFEGAQKRICFNLFTMQGCEEMHKLQNMVFCIRFCCCCSGGCGFSIIPGNRLVIVITCTRGVGIDTAARFMTPTSDIQARRLKS